MIDPSETIILRLASEALVDPRTASKALVLGPASLRPKTRQRVETALARMGYDPADASQYAWIRDL
jgi:DNA-binding LacI/PurR family transcriptional regulator